MTKAIKQKFMRMLSFLLVIAILLPTFTVTPAYADTLDEVTKDSIQDSVSVVSAGDWSTAIYKDGLAWNAFHNAVQAEIRKKYLDMGIKNFQSPIKMKKENQPEKQEGRICIWRKLIIIKLIFGKLNQRLIQWTLNGKRE